MLKISVIVPVYNVERYLRKCLDSLIKQTLDDMEIICVNDGSTDKSLDIINEFAQKDKRIVVVNKKNAGLGAAYNSGIEIAKGEYIGFVEPDDYTSPNMYEELYNCTKTKPDIVRSDWFLDKGGKISKENKLGYFEEGIYKNKDLPLFDGNIGHWASIFNNYNFIKKYNIRYTPSPGAAFQDIGFMLKAYVLAKDIYVRPYQYYYYRIHPAQSITDSAHKSLKFVADEYTNVLNYFNENKQARDSIDLKLLNHYTYILIERPINSYKYVKRISKILNSDLFKSGYSSENFSEKTNYIYKLVITNPLMAYMHIRFISLKFLFDCYF